VGAVRFGPAMVPSRESPEEAIELLTGARYDAGEIDCESGVGLDWDYAERFGDLAREAAIALSLHAPLFAFVGRPGRDRKHRMAVGMLDHSAGLAVTCGAELMVVHPGYLFGRSHDEAVASVVEQLAEVRERLESKGRAIPFGMEVMGRVRELGTLDDVLAICSNLPWVRPVLDFAHLHAVSDGAFTSPEPFHAALASADALLEPGAPFHIHFSDIDFANRNEKSHLPYGQGTLRADPLGEALDGFERPATVIGESPDEESNQAIRTVLAGRA
jgi:deoxyribonuclease-4